MILYKAIVTTRVDGNTHKYLSGTDLRQRHNCMCRKSFKPQILRPNQGFTEFLVSYESCQRLSHHINTNIHTHTQTHRHTPQAIGAYVATVA